MVEQKSILLSEITPDPNQPRKFYDEAAMNELTDSVREKGVLQPILVRPNGKGYMLVCGERRYIASKAAFLKEIPAVIRELTDDEALELQIIENLQRKDVHPMEEAVAFKSLLEKGKEIKEIAARVGKNEYYVRQRLKLNDLSKQWQVAFYDNQITTILALKISGYDEKTQKKLYEDTGKESGKIEINNWHFNNLSGNLAKASFDLSDTTLDKKAGACISCPFNSAVASLFPESAENPICSKISCFKHKSDIHFDRALKAACEDPEIILVDTRWHSQKNELVDRLKKDGYDVLSIHNSMVLEPEKPIYDEEDYDPDEFDNEKECRESFEEDLKEYQKDLAAFKNKVAGGKLKKGFVVVGDDKGKIVYFEMSKTCTSSKSSKATKEKEASGDLTADDINEEIKRLQEREKRAKELDLEKIHVATLDALKSFKEFDPKKPLSMKFQPIDRGIMIYLLLEAAGMTNDTIKGLPEPDRKIQNGYDEKYFESLSKVSNETLSLVIRVVAMDKYGNRNLINGIDVEDTILRLMARYVGVNLPAIELAQNEIAINRKERVDKRIKQLQDKKKELAAPKKSAPKKAAKKK